MKTRILAFLLLCPTWSHAFDLLGIVDAVKDNNKARLTRQAVNATRELSKPQNAAEPDIFARVQDPEIETYVRSLFSKLHKASGFGTRLEVEILDSAQVQGQAWWLADKVFVTRGMLNLIENEDELAALLSHEIGHFKLGHALAGGRKRGGLESTTDTLVKETAGVGKYLEYDSDKNDLLNAARSKEHETQADLYGAELAASLGYEATALANLFERASSLAEGGLLYRFRKLKGSHPTLGARANAVRKQATRLGAAKPSVSDNGERYQQALKGLTQWPQTPGKGNLSDALAELNKPRAELKTQITRIQLEVAELKASGGKTSAKQFMRWMRDLSEGLAAASIEPVKPLPGGTGSFIEEEIWLQAPLWGGSAQDMDAQITGRRAENLLKEIGRLGLGFIPIIGDAADLYEVLGGEEFISGRELDPGERALTAMALIVGSGAAWREGSEALFSEAGKVSRLSDGHKKAWYETFENLDLDNRTVVLGRVPSYLELARTTHAKKFNLPTKILEDIHRNDDKIWELNKKFLDKAILSKSPIRLSTDPVLAPKTSFFFKEIEYLKSKGYKFFKDDLGDMFMVLG